MTVRMGRLVPPEGLPAEMAPDCGLGVDLLGSPAAVVPVCARRHMT